ncbi:MAG TPA: 2-dehydropantoate 2-reductase [Candidatus Fimimorpha excrementavium]|nr:2-dehydropantoate 2-reductase [Candidatus Fimimorpha excrementavium]
MRIAIYGAGSLGTIMGAYLTKAGIPVEMINRNKKHVEALKKNGAVVTGTVSMQVPVTAYLPEEMNGTYDIIFLMTKQLDNAATVTRLKEYLSRDGIICTLQNGLPEPEIAKIVGESQVMGCTVAWGATLKEPGVSELTSEPDSLSFGLGKMDQVPEKKMEEVKEILEHMCPVEVEENFMGVRFSKLLINAAFSGMSAVLGCTFGEAAQDKRSRVCVQNLMKECMDVAEAAGIRIAPIQGKDVVRLLNYNNPVKKKISFLLIPIAIKKHAKLKASMLQDLEKGKPCEVDAINGVVCQFGKKYHVATPYNDKVVEIIHGMEVGKGKPGFENLREFEGMKG